MPPLLKYILLLTPVYAFTQNLVPNPGFEQYNTCNGGVYPDSNASQFGTTFWYSPTEFYTGAYNTCDGSVPCPPVGSCKNPHSGDGYALVEIYSDQPQYGNINNNSRSYLQVQLISPLKADSFYRVTFYASPTRERCVLNFTTDQVGINFSTGRTTNYISIAPLRLSYDIANPTGHILTDTLTWYQICGIYKAKGGEKFLTLGNFSDNSNTTIRLVGGNAGQGSNDSCGFMCIDDVSVTPLYVHNPANDTVICQNAPFTKIFNAYTMASSYLWNTGQTTQSITVNQPGVYTVQMAVDCGQITDTMRITTRTLLSLPAISDTVYCNNGQGLYLHVDTGFTHYLWSTGDTLAFITIDTSGTYNIRASYYCGSYSDSFSVTILPVPRPPVTFDTFYCLGATAKALMATGQNLNWYTGAYSDTLLSSPPVPYTNLPGKQFFYVSQTVNGCQSDRAGLVVNVEAPPAWQATNNIVLCEGQNYITQLPTDTGYHFSWNTGDTTAQLILTTSGAYTAQVTNTCGAVSDTIITSAENCVACLYIPNAFTPNNDGRNDVFRAFTNCPLSYYRMQVFNRIGEKVFETTDENTGWDGAYRNVAQLPGVFVCHIALVYTDGNAESFNGAVTLIR